MNEPVGCRETQLELESLVLDDVEPEGRVREHLDACADCRAELEAARALLTRLQSAPAESEAPPAAVADWVLAQQQRRPKSPTKRTRRPSRRTATQTRGPSRVLLLAAVVLCAGLLALVATLRTPKPRGSTPDEVATNDQRSPAAQPQPSRTAKTAPKTAPPPRDPRPDPSPTRTPDPTETPRPIATPEPTKAPKPNPTPTTTPTPVLTPTPKPSPTPKRSDPPPSRTLKRMVVARVEKGDVSLPKTQGAVVQRGDTIKVRKKGARLALEGGGVLLIAARSEVTFDGTSSIAVARGEAVVDLRGAKGSLALTLGERKGEVHPGGRLLMIVTRPGRGRLRVLNGNVRVGGQAIPAGRQLRLAAKLGSPKRWKAAEPRWAQRLRPTETVLLELKRDLPAFATLWEGGRYEAWRGRPSLLLGPKPSKKHAVTCSRRFQATVDPRFELQVELVVEEPLTIQVNLKNDTRDDNGLWKFSARPGRVETFRLPLARFKAADKSPAAFRAGDVVDKVTFYAGKPGTSPRVRLLNVRLVRVNR